MPPLHTPPRPGKPQVEEGKPDPAVYEDLPDGDEDGDGEIDFEDEEENEE